VQGAAADAHVAVSDLTERTRAALAHAGPLAEKLSGYVVRNAQLHLAEAVADAMDARATLIAEAAPALARPTPIWSPRCSRASA